MITLPHPGDMRMDSGPPKTVPHLFLNPPYSAHGYDLDAAALRRAIYIFFSEAPGQTHTEIVIKIVRNI